MTTKDVQNQQKSWAETPPINPPLRHIIGEYVENQTWLDMLSNPFQSWLLKLFGQPGEPNRKIKNMLNGTWLGHAVHPMLTDIPLGAWTGTTLLDIAALAGENKDIENSADLTLVLGLLGAGGAAVTGVTDWSDLDGTDRRVGMMHGLLNGSITVMYLVSLIMRRTGQRRAGVALSTLGYLASLFSAYLGGEMVFAKGVGVNHGRLGRWLGRLCLSHACQRPASRQADSRGCCWHSSSIAERGQSHLRHCRHLFSPRWPTG